MLRGPVLGSRGPCAVCLRPGFWPAHALAHAFLESDIPPGALPSSSFPRLGSAKLIDELRSHRPFSFPPKSTVLIHTSRLCIQHHPPPHIVSHLPIIPPTCIQQLVQLREPSNTQLVPPPFCLSEDHSLSSSTFSFSFPHLPSSKGRYRCTETPSRSSL
ncbi:hypothetical protein EDD36DRAFT_124999 [Exophiala viscosa]|uniref:Uncharacterized protein n=1 Tax=Exophiala viscosa TaxID=2486360 RepID=A0AAN6II64_9EURO|nr:hypothetical protein EDD36DRAFT_124999 [Exophiala viscosa]